MPAGTLDVVSQTENAEATEPGYAWERLPSWLAEVHGVYEEIGSRPIVGVDVCSSVPIYAQTLRAYEFARSGVRASELVRTLFSNETFAQLADTTLQPVALALSKSKDARRLLVAATQEVLYTLTADETYRDDDRPNRKLISHLEQQIATQHTTYEKFHVSSDLRFKTTDSKATYLEKVTDLAIPSDLALTARTRLSQGVGDTNADIKLAKDTKLVGEDQAQKLIRWQARYLADHISGNKRFRPARFFSVDIADPQEIASSSAMNSSQSSQQLELFKYAMNSLGDANQHIQGNIFDKLPFPDNSLAHITCIDAWPFHFQLDEKKHESHEDFGKVALDVLIDFYNKLAPGGKIVIFPWAVHSDSYAERKAADRVLNAVAVEFARQIKGCVNRQIHHVETLESWMSVADKETSDKMSPVFSNGVDHLEALMVTKPKESSLRNRERINTIGSTAVSKARARG